MKILQINDNSEILIQKGIIQKTVTEIIICPDELSRLLWELFLIKFAEENVQFDIPANSRHEDFVVYFAETIKVYWKEKPTAETKDINLCALAKTAIYLKELSEYEK